MVGMDAQVKYENSTEKDGVYGKSLEPCVQANGDAIFHLEDSGTPPTSAGSEVNKGSALCPITPVLNRETEDSVVVASTPLSREIPCPKAVPNVGCFQSKRIEVVASANDLSPRTPDEGVFDPFAPGPDEMLLAPICNKLMVESQKIVARRLSFDDITDFQENSGDDDNPDSLSEKMLVESFYGSLLEAIILKQSEEFYAENQPSETKGAQTPTSPPPLTGVAETCPGAPMKHAASKLRVIDPGLCRKLEF